uniref:Uncharacterized protein n=1 Tax=Rhizophora mucronata TaxID=61149 RepID=A0A2P2IZN9_RHIMU
MAVHPVAKPRCWSGTSSGLPLGELVHMPLYNLSHPPSSVSIPEISVPSLSL